MAQYIEVVSVTAPAQVEPGARVDVSLKLKNISSAPISVYGVITPWDGGQVLAVTYLSSQLGTLNSGATMDISGYFTMPGVNVTVQCWSYWYGSDDVYHFDDEKMATVSLLTVARATIVAKTLGYDGISAPIPSYDIRQGTAVQLRITIRNDCPATERLGIYITVYDPSGNIVYTYAVYEDIFWGTQPGENHEFVARPDFLLEKVGEYRIWIGAYVYPEGVVTVETFEGVLCTVAPQEIPTGLKNTSLNVVLDDYDYFDAVPYVLSYDYKGKAQSGTLLIELGTGLWPSFSPEAVIGPLSYNFPQKDDYTRIVENRTFALPDTLRRGQTYSARATLRTADGLECSDTDYTALRVKDLEIPSTELKDLTVITSYREYGLGDTLPITITYKYQGVAQGGQYQVLLGTGVIFSPAYSYAPQPLQFDRSDVLTSITRNLEITLPQILEPGQVYSVKIILETADGKHIEEKKGSAFRVGDNEIPEDPGTGEYRVIKDYAYPYAENYSGTASQCTYEFTVPLAQMPGTDWISQKVIDSHEDEVVKRGSRMLHLKVSERDQGITSKDYLVVATATSPQETAGQEYSPQGIISLKRTTALVIPLLAWVAITAGVLAILGLVVKAVIKETRTFLWGEEGEPAEGWGETVGLILVMGLMAAMTTAMPKVTQWVESGTTKLVEKGKAKIEAKVS